MAHPTRNVTTRIDSRSGFRKNTAPEPPLRCVRRFVGIVRVSGRPSAVRALVLYPMNALVEDQIVRLRKAIDSSEARQAMDEHFRGNRIFFGRYIGVTPETGHRGTPESPCGLDAFLAGGKQAARTLGTIRFPGHKRADHNDNVAYEDVWQDELDRRRRRLDRLFDHVVGSRTRPTAGTALRSRRAGESGPPAETSSMGARARIDGSKGYLS